MKIEPRICYCYDLDGFYSGHDSDYGQPLPCNGTYDKPKSKEGFLPRWNGEAWEQIENHKGKTGYINGEPYEIKEYGPLPEGWSTEPPPDTRTPDEIRIAEIKSRLEEIDRFVIRPMRAKLAGMATAEDEIILVELEHESKALRDELSTLANAIKK